MTHAQIAELKAKAEAELVNSDRYKVHEFDTLFGKQTAKYIAAANPQTVLKLIEKLERYEETLKFSIHHLNSMKNYSLVQGAIYRMKEALREEAADGE